MKFRVNFLWVTSRANGECTCAFGLWENTGVQVFHGHMRLHTFWGQGFISGPSLQETGNDWDLEHHHKVNRLHGSSRGCVSRTGTRCAHGFCFDNNQSRSRVEAHRDRSAQLQTEFCLICKVADFKPSQQIFVCTNCISFLNHCYFVQLCT